VLKLFEEPS